MDLALQYDKLLRYCYMKTKDRYMAEDIVQEAFLKFWQSRTYEDTGKEMAYLYAIARNLCTDEFRKPRTEDIEDFPELPDSGAGDEQQIVDRLAVEQALDTLPEELREAVVLRYMNGLSAADIGVITGMSRFAATRRIKEGVRLLKNIMEGEAGNDGQTD